MNNFQNIEILELQDESNNVVDALSQLSPEQVEQFRKYFNMFDKENKGFIRATQVGQILRTMGQAFEERDLKQLIKEFDTDGILKGNDGLEEELREAFRLYDKEGNGYIAVSDLRDILRALDENVSEEELDEMIADIDTDGSGTVVCVVFVGSCGYGIVKRIDVVATCQFVAWQVKEMLRTATKLKYSAGRPSIGLALFGCKNRPAYRIVVFPDKAYGRHYEGSIIEELGIFDPLPNFRNEKLVACDISRVKYWIGERNAHISPSLLELLGSKSFRTLGCTASTSEDFHSSATLSRRIGKTESKVYSITSQPECLKLVMLPHNSHDSKVFRNIYTFENDTQKCDRVESVLISSRPPFCDPHDLNVTFSSVAVLPNGINMLPYILLNISIWINNPVSSVFLRLECLEAPNLDDDYCHNHEEQYRRWGRMIWPCRFITLSEPDIVSCTTLIIKRNCWKSFILTIPEETQAHPAINRFYNKDALIGDNSWSPLVYVDLTFARRKVVIRYERQPTFVSARISIAVFETTAFSYIHLFTDTLDVAAVEYEWKNVPAGNFTAYLYVNRIDCNLICNSDTANECILCPNTKIHFTIEEDKIWFSVSLQSLLSYGIYIIG
ncbi:Troponin C [Dirofilaria immitis]|nr:Troponin C [Dirofilaria immitis]